MSITIKKTDRRLWTVGCIDAAGFTPLIDCACTEEAMAYMSYLNGGEHPSQQRGYWDAKAVDS
jgi:hypothetical protein